MEHSVRCARYVHVQKHAFENAIGDIQLLLVRFAVTGKQLNRRRSATRDFIYLQIVNKVSTKYIAMLPLRVLVIVSDTVHRPVGVYASSAWSSNVFLPSLLLALDAGQGGWVGGRVDPASCACVGGGGGKHQIIFAGGYADVVVCSAQSSHCDDGQDLH
jgi:hypothetical protein